MSVTRKASHTGTVTTGGSTLTSDYNSYVPAVGEFVRLDVLYAKGSAGLATDPTTPAGFTLIAKTTFNNSSGGASTGLYTYGRFADGTASDNAPSFTGLGTTNTLWAWQVTVDAGLDPAHLPTFPSTPPAAGNTSTGGTGAVLTSNSDTTTTANETVYSSVGGRCGSVLTSFTWGGGSSDDLGAFKNGTALILDSGKQTVAAASTVTPQVTFTATGTAIAFVMHSFSMQLAPPPTANGSLTLGGSGAGLAPATGSGSIALTGAATDRTPATGSAAVTLTAVSIGSASTTATATVSLAANASPAAAASGDASLTLTGTASGSAGASSGVGSLSLSAAGIDSARPSGTASITVAGTAAIVAAATSSATLTLSGAAVAAIRASATASITLGSSVLATASGTATLTLNGSAIIPQADVTVSLPVGAFTLAAPTATIVGDVVIGLPVGQLTFAAAAPFIGTPDPVDQILAAVYDRDGSFLAMLPTVRSSNWQEVLSQPGSAAFEVPLDDATTALLTNRRIVKQFWQHGGVTRARFSCRLAAEKASIAVEGRRWLKFEDQPGGMALVGDGTVYPEYGLASSTSATRNFGYMSAATFWQVPGAWVAPLGTRWDAPGPENAHSHTPPEFSVDPSAQWISRTNPNVTQPYRVAQYFRATFTLDAQTDVEILASGDNYMDLYIDGEQIFTADYTHMNAWWSAQSQTIRLSAGEHLIAVRVENGVKTLVRNPVAFICTVRSLDSKGNPTGVLLRTNTTDWVCCDDTPEPGWHRAQVLLKVLLEAQARGVYGLQHVTFGFTYDHDSAGQPWLDRGNYIIDVGTVSLVDVIAQLTEADMDVTFDHAAMRLHAWRRAGRDRSGTVALTTGDHNGTLKSYDVETTNTRFTAVITQLSSGRWVETESASAIAAIGRVEAGLSLGSTVTDPSAIGVAQKQIEESSEPLITLDGQTSILDGPQLYGDYFLGDSITVPNQRATGTMKARVMMGTVSQVEDANGPPVQAYPGLVQDRST